MAEIHDLETLTIAGREFTRAEFPGRLPDTSGWMHSGCSILADGTVAVAHPEGRKLILFGADGTRKLVEVPVLEMHTILRDVIDGRESLWLVNNGHRFVKDEPDYAHYREGGSVIRVTPDGEVLQSIECPRTLDYTDEKWQPTSICRGDDGSIWVADGYGLSLLHQFDSEGEYLHTVDGSDSGTPFSCPHGIAPRGDQILVADRSNRRIVVLESGRIVSDLDAPLTSPSSILVADDWLIVTELFGGLAVFHEDRYIGHFARSTVDSNQDAWPNDRDARGNMTAPAPDGTLRSPHGIAYDGDRLLVTEWLVGGRLNLFTSSRGR